MRLLKDIISFDQVVEKPKLPSPKPKLPLNAPGGVEYRGLDGPTVIIGLKGRFWHQRTTVLERVANYLQQRIPEIVDVQVEDPWQLTDEANEVW